MYIKYGMMSQNKLHKMRVTCIKTLKVVQYKKNLKQLDTWHDFEL
jgi:hypothetical protein